MHFLQLFEVSTLIEKYGLDLVAEPSSYSRHYNHNKYNLNDQILEGVGLYTLRILYQDKYLINEGTGEKPKIIKCTIPIGSSNNNGIFSSNYIEQNYIKTEDLEKNYASKAYVETEISNINLNDYALKSDINNIELLKQIELEYNDDHYSDESLTKLQSDSKAITPLVVFNFVNYLMEMVLESYRKYDDLSYRDDEIVLKSSLMNYYDKSESDDKYALKSSLEVYRTKDDLTHIAIKELKYHMYSIVSEDYPNSGLIIDEEVLENKFHIKGTTTDDEFEFDIDLSISKQYNIEGTYTNLIVSINSNDNKIHIEFRGSSGFPLSNNIIYSLVGKGLTNIALIADIPNIDLTNYYSKSESDGKYALKTDINNVELIKGDEIQFDDNDNLTQKSDSMLQNTDDKAISGTAAWHLIAYLDDKIDTQYVIIDNQKRNYNDLSYKEVESYEFSNVGSGYVNNTTSLEGFHITGYYERNDVIHSLDIIFHSEGTFQNGAYTYYYDFVETIDNEDIYFKYTTQSDYNRCFDIKLGSNSNEINYKANIDVEKIIHDDELALKSECNDKYVLKSDISKNISINTDKTIDLGLINVVATNPHSIFNRLYTGYVSNINANDYILFALGKEKEKEQEVYFAYKEPGIGVLGINSANDIITYTKTQIDLNRNTSINGNLNITTNTLKNGPGVIDVNATGRTVFNQIFTGNVSDVKNGDYVMIVLGKEHTTDCEAYFAYKDPGIGTFGICNADNIITYSKSNINLNKNTSIDGNLIVSGSIKASNVNTTIIHYCPIDKSNNINDFVIGTPVYINGSAYKYVENRFIESTNNDTTDCICGVKTSGSWKEYIGICVRIDYKNNCITFASGGDYLIKVDDSSCYSIGDEVFVDTEDNKLKILSGATAITSKIKRTVVGIITAIIDEKTLAVFK